MVIFNLDATIMAVATIAITYTPGAPDHTCLHRSQRSRFVNPLTAYPFQACPGVISTDELTETSH